MLKRIAYRTICVVLLVSLIQTPANATAILVVVKPDAVWIAADGMRSGGSSGWFAVCKAHRAYGGVILKYGYVGDESPNTDDILQKLIRDNKSYGAFKKAVSTMLPIFMNSAALSDHTFDVDSEQEISGQELNKSVGLIFVGVSSGRLFVEQFNLEPTWIHESNIPGHQGRLNYVPADWKDIGRQPASFLFPGGLRVRRENTQWAFDHPDNLLHGALEVLERETPCFTGPPNLYMKVSVGVPLNGRRYSKRELRELANTAVIDPISPGGCPSWEVLPTPRPVRCTEFEQQRELQGGSAVQ
jgi:hypothetical protein